MRKKQDNSTLFEPFGCANGQFEWKRQGKRILHSADEIKVSMITCRGQVSGRHATRRHSSTATYLSAVEEISELWLTCQIRMTGKQLTKSPEPPRSATSFLSPS